MKPHMIKTLVISAAMAVATIASAETWVHVNFGKAKIEAELVGPAGGSGERWNQAGTAISAAGLTNSTGAATTIGWAMGGGSLTTGNDWNNAANLEMLESAFFQPNGTARTLTITGLNAGSKYALYIASYDQNAWGIGAMTFSSTNVADQVAANIGDAATWVLDDNYVVFDGLVPDVSNSIVILGAETGGGSYGFWSGFQLKETPGPPAGTIVVIK